jgi:hypothetical protein
MSDRVLIRGAITQRQAEKPHPTELVTDHELHPRVREVMLALKYQSLVHVPTTRHGFKCRGTPAKQTVDRTAPALAAVTVAKPFDQPTAEILEVHRLLQNLQRVAILAQGFKVVVQAEQRLRVHDVALHAQ